ncbi:MAG: ABC transporter [Firmicutes bacterium HGW-Firmicutes-7]|nr:MAG: ABC transporter [Firmicutes bacterium HGW-Firmicutes-7]
MRLLSAIKSDIIFQFRQGFYIIYIVICIAYMVGLSWIPNPGLKYVVPLVVFSDPAVLGLFFIGGIIMLEKVQGVIQAVVVTPLSTREFIQSKVISLSIISILAGIIITRLTYIGNVKWIILVIALVLTSSLFTLCGLVIGAKCKTVNQYFVKIIPVMLLFIIPCFSIIGFKYSYFLTLFPSVAALRLLLGAYLDMGGLEQFFLICYLLIINYGLLLHTEKVFDKYVVYGG